MNNDNVFDLPIAVFFVMSSQLGGLGPKLKILWYPFALLKGKLLHNYT